VKRTQIIATYANNLLGHRPHCTEALAKLRLGCRLVSHIPIRVVQPHLVLAFGTPMICEPFPEARFQVAGALHHQSLMHTVCDVFGFTKRPGAAGNASSMSDVF